MVLVIFFLWSIVYCTLVSSTNFLETELLTLMGESKGFAVDPLGDIEPAQSPDVLKCPSENLITSRQKCKVGPDWVDCTRKHCCKDYTFIAGRCIHKDTDPCSLDLCEQKCSVYWQRVICTCFHGYQYSSHNQRQRIKPVCIDINECLENNGDCEQHCINVPGSYHCECDKGYTLNRDNRTCDYNINMTFTGPIAAAIKEKCYANCDTVSRLQENIRLLHQQIADLNTAVRLLSYSRGPPGQPGPPGPIGSTGPRGLPGADGNKYNNPRDLSYSMMDSYSATPNGHCKCQRGPVGAPGAPGPEGPKGTAGIKGSKGPRGQRGSFDFVLLLLSDLRHDIINLENTVYAKGESPPKFNIQNAWKKQRMKDKIQQFEDRALGAYASPIIHKSGVSITTDGESGEIKQKSEKMQLKGDINEYMESIKKIMEQSHTYNRKTKIEAEDESDDDDDSGDYDYRV